MRAKGVLPVGLSVVLVLAAGRAMGGGPAEPVEILRDDRGIPHVFAASEDGAFFGLGYAMAEDRMFQMEYARRVIQGRIAEVFGEVPGAGGATSVEQDIRWRIEGLYRHAVALEGRLPADVAGPLQAFADGVNRYLVENRGRLHPLFARYGIEPEPWRIADSIACWMRIAEIFGGGDPTRKARGLHELEDRAAQIGWEAAVAERRAAIQARVIDESAAIVAESDVDPDLREAIVAFAADHGFGDGAPGAAGPIPGRKMSHAWVVGGLRSTTGSAVLESDPQTAVRCPSIWYEFHAAGGAMDARGVGIPGCPGILIGWSRRLAWGVTALGSDKADLYRLAIDPRDPERYLYDGRSLAFATRTERIGVRGGAAREIAVRETVIGPVVTDRVPRQDLRRGEAYAMKKIPLADADTHTVVALIRMMRARDLEAFIEALRDYRDPGVHMIVGDADGRIAYRTLAAIPLRSSKSPLGGAIAQDGSSSEYDWQGTIPPAFLPQAIDPAAGAIGTANNLPAGSWYPLPLGIGTGGSGDTTRSWRLRELLGSRGTFAPEDVLAIHDDTVNPARRELVRLGYHLLDTLGETMDPSAARLLEALRGWWGRGARSDTEDPGYPGVHFMSTGFRESDTPLARVYGGGGSGLCLFLKTLKARLEEDPRAALSREERAYVERALRAGWEGASRALGRDPAAWGEAFRERRARVRIPYFASFEGYGSLDPRLDFTTPPLRCVDGGTIRSQHGNSFIQWVDLADVDASRSLLPPGESEDPASPFFRDQVDDWVAGRLRPAPLSRDRVEAIATSRRVLGPAVAFRRGDANADGAVNIGDPVFTLRRLFAGGEAPACADAVDANDDGRLDLADAIAALQYLFAGGPAPRLPGPAACGVDPTGDDLGCARFPPCR